MAEKEGGRIEGIFGAGEEEERDAEDSAARVESDAAIATAVAVAMDAARYDPELSRKAGNFLDEQRSLALISTELVKLQVHHFDEERKLAIGAAKRKRFFDNLRMSFQVFLSLVVTAIGLGAISMVWDAVNSRNVIVDSFAVPHSLVEQGLAGKTVAAGLLDVLTQIQAETRNNAQRRSLSNAWTNEITIEVPETGLSIEQIERALRARFGHDQHIEGDVVLTDTGGLVLTVRGTGILAKTFTDDKRDLDKLLTEAGEYIYGQSQPGLWMNYLSNNDRNDDAIRFAQMAYSTLADDEKPYVLNYWGNSIENKGGAGVSQKILPFYREAVRLKPDYWHGYSNIFNALFESGDEEGAVRVALQMMRDAGGRPGRAPETFYQWYDHAMMNMIDLRAETIADIVSTGGVGSQSTSAGAVNLRAAWVDVLMHDTDSATLRIKTTLIDEKNAYDVNLAAMTRALLAEEYGDTETAAKAWDVLATVYSNPSVSATKPTYICYAAPTYEKSGQPAKADAALNAPLKATGYSTFVDCYRFKADVLDLRGDWVHAQAWYEKAIKLAPSIPAGYYSYGLALAKHGDLNGAAEQFKLASQKGPHWADPLKAWGDVLMKQGKSEAAINKYDDAVKYAPNWEQLTEARKAAMKGT